MMNVSSIPDKPNSGTTAFRVFELVIGKPYQAISGTASLLTSFFSRKRSKKRCSASRKHVAQIYQSIETSQSQCFWFFFLKKNSRANPEKRPCNTTEKSSE
jgi:hypothetical protein